MAEVYSCRHVSWARLLMSAQMKRTALSHVSNEKVFGYRRPHDSEGAGIGKLHWTPIYVIGDVRCCALQRKASHALPHLACGEERSASLAAPDISTR